VLHPLDILEGLHRSDYDGLAKLAKNQDNVVARPQLLTLHFSDKQIGLFLERGHWLQLQRGVYLLGRGPATWRQLARAAQLAGGDVVALDAGSALVWWCVEGPKEAEIELVLTSGRGKPEPRGCVLRQPSRSLTVRTREGVRVVCLEDALLGYAASCNDRAAVEFAVESVLLSRRSTERKIWQTIGRNSRPGVRGVALLRSVMEKRPDGKPARSHLELEVLDLIRRSGLPLPARNFDVVDGDGNHREIDLCYVAQKGAIEADSRRWHSTATQKAEDRRRQRALEAVGFQFVRVTWRDVFDRPDWVIAEIRQLLQRIVAA
jgi:hypothetical protein